MLLCAISVDDHFQMYYRLINILHPKIDLLTFLDLPLVRLSVAAWTVHIPLSHTLKLEQHVDDTKVKHTVQELKITTLTSQD